MTFWPSTKQTPQPASTQATPVTPQPQPLPVTKTNLFGTNQLETAKITVPTQTPIVAPTPIFSLGKAPSLFSKTSETTKQVATTPDEGTIAKIRNVGEYLFNPKAEVAYPRIIGATEQEQQAAGTLKGPRIFTGTAKVINDLAAATVEGVFYQFPTYTKDAFKKLIGDTSPTAGPFNLNPQRFNIPSDDGKNIVPLGEQTLRRQEELDTERPNTKAINTLQAFGEVILPQIFNGFIAGDVTKGITKEILSATKSSPMLGIRASSIANLSPQDAVREISTRFFDKAGKIAKTYTNSEGVLSGAGKKQMMQLVNETQRLGRAFSDSTIKSLNPVGKLFDDLAIRLNQNVGSITNPLGLTVPKFNPAGETIPGYRAAGTKMAPAGLSVQPIEPVGFGPKKNWKPVMTKPEAETFAKDSTLQGTFYHGADAETATKIRTGGFKPSSDFPSHGAISLTNSEAGAENYAKLSGKPGEVLPVKISAKNVKTYANPGEYLDAVEAQAGATSGAKESSLLSQFDAVVVKNGLGGGSDMVLVPNPQNLTVIAPAAAKAPSAVVFKGFSDITTSILEKLKNRDKVSKQFISDLTNSPELKKNEQTIIRSVLESYPDGTDIPVAEFADKVKAELLPLDRETVVKDTMRAGEQSVGGRYENVALPSDQRGTVDNYSEHIYTGPVETSAGDIHFADVSLGEQTGKDTRNYFGHTRVEDIPGDIRRVIEVQSDLYQKGGLEAATEREVGFGQSKANKNAIAKLSQYNNPTAHLRMVREEIKAAAKDGKTKLQFPTGETAMKIEGLGDREQWVLGSDWMGGRDLQEKHLKVGENITNRAGIHWVITDVLGEGRFKAVPKNVIDRYVENGFTQEKALEQIKKEGSRIETFDISGKVDTSNPIFKFYEKELGKYLSSKYSAKKITDPQGVTWYEVAIKPEQGPSPVFAFTRKGGIIKNNEQRISNTTSENKQPNAGSRNRDGKTDGGISQDTIRRSVESPSSLPGGLNAGSLENEQEAVFRYTERSLSDLEANGLPAKSVEALSNFLKQAPKVITDSAVSIKIINGPSDAYGSVVMLPNNNGKWSLNLYSDGFKDDMFTSGDVINHEVYGHIVNDFMKPEFRARINDDISLLIEQETDFAKSLFASKEEYEKYVYDSVDATKYAIWDTVHYDGALKPKFNKAFMDAGLVNFFGKSIVRGFAEDIKVAINSKAALQKALAANGIEINGILKNYLQNPSNLLAGEWYSRLVQHVMKNGMSDIPKGTALYTQLEASVKGSKEMFAHITDNPSQEAMAYARRESPERIPNRVLNEIEIEALKKELNDLKDKIPKVSDMAREAMVKRLNEITKQLRQQGAIKHSMETRAKKPPTPKVETPAPIITTDRSDRLLIEKGLREMTKLENKGAFMERIKIKLPNELETRATELMIRKEALDENPLGNLIKFMGRRGAFKGALPEVTGEGKGMFSKRGDTLISEATGLKDSEEARIKFVEYMERRKEWEKDMAQYQKDKNTFLAEARGKRNEIISEKKVENLTAKTERHINEILGTEAQRKARIEKLKIKEAETQEKLKAIEEQKSKYLRMVEKAHLDDSKKRGILGKFREILSPISQTDPTTQRIYIDWETDKLAAKENGNKVYETFKAKPQNDLPSIFEYEAGAQTPWIRDAFDDLFTEAQRADLDPYYKENYIPHVYKEKPEQIKKAIVEYMKDQKVPSEIVDEFAKTGEITDKMAIRLKINPSFIRVRTFPDYQTAMKYNLTPKFNTVAAHLAYYKEEMGKSIANRTLIENLIKEGKLLDSYDAPRSWLEVKLPGRLNRTYYADPVLANSLNSQFRDEDNLNFGQEISKRVSVLSDTLQAVILGGGLPNTTINSFAIGQAIRMLTTGVGNVAQFNLRGASTSIKAAASFLRANFNNASLQWFRDNSEYIDLMVKHNAPMFSKLSDYSQSQKTWSNLVSKNNIRNTLIDTKARSIQLGKVRSLKDLGTAAKDIIDSRAVGVSVDIFNKIINDKTFLSMMPQMQIQVFKDIYRRSLKAGLGEEEAAKFAADTVSTEFGKIKDLGRNKTIRDLIKAIFMASRFREGMINIFVNAAKGWTTEFRNPLFSRSRALLLGMIITFVIYDFINRELNNGQDMWENETGREFALKIPLPNGQIIYIEFMPSSMAFIRNIASGAIAVTKGDNKTAAQKFGSLFSIPIHIVTDVIGNKDYFGRQIYDPNDDIVQKTKAVAEYVGLSVSHPIIREIVRYLEGKQNIWQTASMIVELPLKFSNQEKAALSRAYEAKAKKSELSAKERHDIKDTLDIFDKIQELKSNGDLEQVRKILGNLSESEKQEYKTIEKYNIIQGLVKNKKKAQAEQLGAELTSEEKLQYTAIKAIRTSQKTTTTFKKKAVTPKYFDGQKVSTKTFLESVATYAHALAIDPATAFDRILTGQTIRRVDNGTVIVERMTLAESQAQKKKGNAASPDFKLDHTIPLELGGSNATDNLKIVPTALWASYTPVENHLAKLLKAKKLSKSEAVDLITKFKKGSIKAEDILKL